MTPCPRCCAVEVHPTLDDCLRSIRGDTSVPAYDLKLPVHLESLIANLEIAYMTACLDRSQGVKSEAAKLLGMNRTTMVEKLRRLKRLEVRQGASIDAMREYLKSLNGSALKPHEPSG